MHGADYLLFNLSAYLDPRQFVFNVHRGVQDPSLWLSDLISSQHLEDDKVYIRRLFTDYMGAINTIDPFVFLKPMSDLNISPNIVLWMKECLRDRPHRVHTSDEIVRHSAKPRVVSSLFTCAQIKRRVKPHTADICKLECLRWPLDKKILCPIMFHKSQSL